MPCAVRSQRDGERMTAGNEVTLALDAQARPFSLPGVDGQTHTLKEMAGSSAVVLLFMSNHCPYVAAWEDRIIGIAREYRDRGVRFLAISSNDVSRYPKDGPEEMSRRALDAAYPFPYLFDEDGTVATAFGATRTPQAFVLDGSMRLKYRGAVDSSWDEDEDREEYLRSALDAILSARPVEVPETPPVGCPIKTKA
jgi:peroxiredoxin